MEAEAWESDRSRSRCSRSSSLGEWTRVRQYLKKNITEAFYLINTMHNYLCLYSILTRHVTWTHKFSIQSHIVCQKCKESSRAGTSKKCRYSFFQECLKC